MASGFDPPIYINVRDRVTPLRALVAWLERAGHERIILLDNGSTYEPCVEYLKATPHDVVALGANYGSRALWLAGLVPNEWFVYTDPDVVPTDQCPRDAVAHLRRLLGRHDHPKAGLGLFLDDVPVTFPHLAWERSLVIHEVEPGAFDSQVDTTFALYRPGSPFVYRALRTAAPYQARHVSPSWYGGELSEEDAFYLAHAKDDDFHGSTWARDWRRDARQVA